MPYKYDGSPIQAERKPVGRDHCPDEGAIYDLSELVVDGWIMDPVNPGQRLSTPPLRGGSRPRWIFGVGPGDVMRLAPDGARGAASPQVKHETLFHNADLSSAGEIHLEEGRIVDINDSSGSYGTDNDLSDEGSAGREFRVAIRRALKRAKARCSGAAAEALSE